MTSTPPSSWAPDAGPVNPMQPGQTNGQRQRRDGPGCVAALVLAGVLVFIAVMTTVIVTIGIWPGEMKLTAGWLCPDDQTDAYVVTDTYQSPNGSGSNTDFTMYCMGDRGQITNVGFFKPAGLLTLAHGALFVALVLVILIFRRLRATTLGDPAIS